MSLELIVRAVACSLAVGAVLIAGVVVARAASAEPACWSDWSDAAQVVMREQLVPAKGVHTLARQHTGGDLVRITLCEQGGAYVYRLLVRDTQGRVTAHTVDARKPFDR